MISGIKVGEKGQAYVVDGDGRLVAHPDISLVLRNTDMSKLAQVQAARAGGNGEDVQEADDITGHKVLTAYAPVHPLGWFVFVETPIEEAYAPLYRSIQRTGYVLFGALALAFVAGTFLARRMVVPIQVLRAGTARIGAGDLAQRIDIKTGDEVESLADQFNDMAGRLQESYANLEKKVDDRTRELSELIGTTDGDFRGAQSHQFVAGRTGARVPRHAGERSPDLRLAIRHSVSTRRRKLRGGCFVRHASGAYRISSKARSISAGCGGRS